MKKSKCSKNTHLWLNPLSPLAHLIMIAPRIKTHLNVSIMYPLGTKILTKKKKIILKVL
jgi:hypothetical protein